MNAETLTRSQLAAKLGVPEHRLEYTPSTPRMNRKTRRKVAKLVRRGAK